MVLILPLPSAGLSPNARGHWRARHRLTVAHRSAAFWRMKEELPQGGAGPVFAGYRLAFFWATKRHRDDDNASAMCKAYRDGMAEALGVDDTTLVQLGPPAMGVDRGNPRLEITLFKTQDCKTQDTRPEEEAKASR